MSKQVVLVRCGSVTHNLTPDQRHITLDFRRETGDILLARVPDNPAVAIVGHYLLFVIASTGRPSAGRFIKICGVGSRAKPWLDEEWWEWLRDRLAQHHQLDPADLRRLRRDRAGSS
jgi:hypothetical protein